MWWGKGTCGAGAVLSSFLSEAQNDPPEIYPRGGANGSACLGARHLQTLPCRCDFSPGNTTEGFSAP